MGTHIPLLLVNGAQQGGDNTYIRKHQNSYMPTKFKNVPSSSISPTEADFSCNKGSTAAVKVFTVKTGDKVGLKQAFGGTGMLHPGPTQVYMSPVSNAASDKGTGTWHKTIPNGQYLVRGEHISLHGAQNGEAEFYYACAQLEVTGNTATTMPGTSVKIPSVYKQADAAVNFSLWGSLTSYNTIPGPDVIPSGTTRGSANGSSGEKSVTVAGGSSASSDIGSKDDF
ncbi:fungal cellulose binding domain-containing protein [Colletotrichum salicis]|uniref:lytic cellulose monooxygenase (C4-dehydrogenating) n=1 Tax=Colletotrichum salicis TaxID=1209931 RepID=A0A135UVI1_9PEZI|nr:fungal cellulose binding domain-containing protein [Colletotrichum salicis]